MTGTERFVEAVETGGRAMGLALQQEQVHRMAIHAAELLAWNEFANLTAITDPKELAEKQFLDVVALPEVVPLAARVLDIGSGGGFPGIPLKVLRSDLEIMLIDGRRKKVSFLKHVIRLLGLKGVATRQVRAEDMAGEIRNGVGLFDVVVSKAVGDLGTLLRLSEPLLERSGMLIAMKGASVAEELEAARDEKALAGFDVSEKAYRLPFCGAERRLVILKRRGGQKA